jgi:gluconate 2-dehydrogenase gamma chain
MKISKLQFNRSRGARLLEDRHEGRGVSRREVLAALLAGGAMAGVWSSASAAAVLKKAGAGAAVHPGLNKSEMAVLGAAAQVIVPATDTPGAQEAGVPLFIDALVARWFTADEAALFRGGLAALDAGARQRFQRGYAACTPQQAAELMQELRAASPYQGHSHSLNDRILDPKAPFYLRLRDLVVLGYFMSEQGSTRELRYLPVPGKFEVNLDMKTWPYQTMI